MNAPSFLIEQHVLPNNSSTSRELGYYLSCPSLVSQYPVEPPFQPPNTHPAPLPASLAYRPGASSPPTTSNPSPFLLSPVLNLPVSFGSAYVGETFRCTLCANNDLTHDDGGDTPAVKKIRDVRIEAEMKTPGLGHQAAQQLELGPPLPADEGASGAGADLAPGATLQRVVSFDLKEEGNHVLAVTVSYSESTETSGRTRTFRKLYQFICKPSLIVRTKVGVLPCPSASKQGRRPPRRRWVLEAQLENCSDDTMQLERVVVEPAPGLAYRDCNWTAADGPTAVKPVLRPGEVEQVCFVVEALSRAAQVARGGVEADEAVDVVAEAEAGGPDARIVFGVLGIGWRGEMGSRGFLSTGKLGTRLVR
ncbi:DUF974 domain-containing protein [Cordyceps militaris CM01]|uniref:DUF974 domain-containing protein n=1 Tax=Cordyceps militaris (strain CM01) TaxID=983644 RepID=G3JSA5_CORMM|nr:DUF974 domain-containing protein [Cordyceps militaris CM01]EGX88804.1 DUF974 domain-containing protein [Cordyceps militaris CM01]